HVDCAAVCVYLAFNLSVVSSGPLARHVTDELLKASDAVAARALEEQLKIGNRAPALVGFPRREDCAHVKTFSRFGKKETGRRAHRLALQGFENLERRGGQRMVGDELSLRHQ